MAAGPNGYGVAAFVILAKPFKCRSAGPNGFGEKTNCISSCRFSGLVPPAGRHSFHHLDFFASCFFSPQNCYSGLDPPAGRHFRRFAGPSASGIAQIQPAYFAPHPPYNCGAYILPFLQGSRLVVVSLKMLPFSTLNRHYFF